MHAHRRAFTARARSLSQTQAHAPTQGSPVTSFGALAQGNAKRPKGEKSEAARSAQGGTREAGPNRGEGAQGGLGPNL